MKYIVKTAGLMCGHCEANTEAHLLEIPGVTNAEADHETNVVEVECDESVTPEQIKSTIEATSEKFSVLDVTVA